MLKISTDGRKAALDMRLVSGAPSSTTSKLDVAADTIVAVWREHRERSYLDTATGERSPLTGALQIVFCDLSTPSERWNAYHELRDLLAGRGLRTRAGPVHSRGPQRSREGAAVRCLSRRARRCDRRLDREDGRRHQHSGPLRRRSSPRLPLAPSRHRATRGPRRTPRQPEPRDRDLPLRRRGQLRRLQLADRRAQSPVHQPGHARTPRRPRDRGHRREHPLLRRSQSTRLRRPAHPRESPRGR